MKTLILAALISIAIARLGGLDNHAVSASETCNAPSLKAVVKIFGGDVEFWSYLSREKVQYKGPKKLRFVVPNGWIVDVPASGGKQYVPGDKFVGGYFYATCIISAGKYVTPRPPTACPNSAVQAYRQIGGEKEHWYFPSMFPGHFPPLVYDAPSEEPVTFVVPLHGLVQIHDDVYLPGYLVTGYYLELICYGNQGWHTL